MNSFEVTIVILTYNFVPEKLMQTLKSILMQRDIDMEIILADDCSENNDISTLERYIHEIGFEGFYKVMNKTHQGKVKNILSAMRRARGQYVMFMSPGNMLYDDHVLNDFFRVAEEKKLNILFGDEIYYRKLKNGEVKVYPEKSQPGRPYCFEESASKTYQNIGFFFGGDIPGAVLFVERETALKYYKAIVPYCTQSESETSMAYALSEGERITYYPRNMLWRELGYTSIKEYYDKKISEEKNEDLKKSYKALKNIHPHNKIIDTAYKKNVLKKGGVSLLFDHPSIMLRAMMYKMSAKKHLQCSIDDTKRLERMLRQ